MSAAQIGDLVVAVVGVLGAAAAWLRAQAAHQALADHVKAQQDSKST